MALVHLFQNKEWNNALLPANESVVLLEVTGGHAVAIKKKLRFLPFHYLRITFGPVTDYTRHADVEAVLNELKLAAKKLGSVYLEFNPFVWDIDLEVYKRTFLSAGFEKAQEHIYKNSIIVDLSLTEEEIFRQFERRGQKAIRQAVDRGITVAKVPLDENNFDVFYALYKNTCSRTAFIPEDKAILKKQMLFWGGKEQAYLFFAYSEAKVVGGLLLFNNVDSVSTVYQGNDYEPEIMNKRPANALYWESLKWARINGFKYYDFGGITVSESYDDEKKQGIFNFKTQFGGRVIALPGNYKFINRKVINAAVNKIIPVYSKVALLLAKRRAYAKK
jgi:lipid II:glycine glycyltransferase (peptidoglycan interpeptide bridge formation enzyme)